MADLKISELTNLTAADPANDMIPIVDVSATPPASGSTKRISINNILACSPTATLASATITGDLTVDTNVLKVDTLNNRVGVNKTSPAVALDVVGAINGFNDITSTNGKLAVSANGQAVGFQIEGFIPSGSFDNYILNNSGTASTVAALNLGRTTSLLFGFIRTNNNSQNLQLGTSGTGSVEFFQNNSPAMTLNSTGLGVGVASPAYKLDVRGSDNSVIAQFGGTNRQVRFVTAANGGFDNANFIVRHDSSVGGFLWQNNNGANTLLTVDASGNVGIGVSPSAKLHVEGGGAQGRFSIASASDARHEYYRNGVIEGLIGWDANVFKMFAFQSGGKLEFYTGGSNLRATIDSSGNVISNVTGTAPTLATNSQMVFNLTSNTNLRISVRGTDGVTRTTNLTLA